MGQNLAGGFTIGWYKCNALRRNCCCVGISHLQRAFNSAICWPIDDSSIWSAQAAPRALIFLWASCQLRKIADAHAPGRPGTFSPPPQVSGPDMHHGTCVPYVPWCMPGSLTSGFLWNWRVGKTFSAFPAHAQPAILRIWQEAHGMYSSNLSVPQNNWNTRYGSHHNGSEHKRSAP